MENKSTKEILDWLKEELNLKRIQVIIPPTKNEIKEAIRDLIKVPEMKDMFESILIMTSDRKDFMGKLNFMLKCNNCNWITNHGFIEFGYSDNRLECKTCNQVNYILSKKDFDGFYVNGDIDSLNFKEVNGELL